MENLIKKKIDHLLDEQNELRKQIDAYTSDRYRLERSNMLPSTVKEKILLDLGIERCRDRKVKVDLELEQMYSELKSLQPKSDKILSIKERRTLLVIIAALAKVAKVDITKITKASETIQSYTDDIEAHVDHGTIEDKLKQIPDALRTRMK